MPNWNKFKRWERVKYFAEKQMEKAYFSGGNCSQTCRNCKQCEASGDTSFATTDNDDGTSLRKCVNCGFEDLTIFTPAGFLSIEEL